MNILPTGSPAYQKRNPHLFPPINENRNLSQSPVIKPIVGNESLAAKKGKDRNSKRVSVRIKSFRKRLIDPDNLCAKFHLDCCRYAGFLRDDSAAEIDYSITQEKVTVKELERTEITIE